MTHQDVAAWEGFAVAMAGAAAVLAGLVFVAVSINIDRILPVRGLPGRAGESVILFLATLCACALVLVPHQPVTALGVELLLLGLVVWGLLLALVVPALRAPSRQPTTWHLTRLVGIHLATVPVVLAGASLLGWLAGGALLARRRDPDSPRRVDRELLGVPRGGRPGPALPAGGGGGAVTSLRGSCGGRTTSSL